MDVATVEKYCTIQLMLMQAGTAQTDEVMKCFLVLEENNLVSCK